MRVSFYNVGFGVIRVIIIYTMTNYFKYTCVMCFFPVVDHDTLGKIN